jgi:hypothetical protein
MIHVIACPVGWQQSLQEDVFQWGAHIVFYKKE